MSFGSGTFISDGKLYRVIDSDDLEKGYDIIDLENGAREGHLNLNAMGRKLADGLRLLRLTKDSWQIYNLDTREYGIVLDRKRYFPHNVFTGADIHTAVDGKKLYVAGARNLIVINLDTMVVEREFNLSETVALTEIHSHYQVNDDHFVIGGIDFVGGHLVISGKSYFDFVMCFNFFEDEKEPLWVNAAWKDMQAKYAGGDLIFGLKANRPVAWDLYTGKVVWSASSLVSANNIDVGEGWVVYFQWIGDINCFHWRKPYESPHKPARNLLE